MRRQEHEATLLGKEQACTSPGAAEGQAGSSPSARLVLSPTRGSHPEGTAGRVPPMPGTLEKSLMGQLLWTGLCVPPRFTC